MISYVIAVVIGFLGIGIDQLTKFSVIENMELYESRPLIKGLINLCYIKNDGAAWGMLGGNRLVLVAVTAVVMAVCIFLLARYAKNKPLLFWAIVLVLSGGVGNMIDRIFRNGLVVDFLQFDFWETFPVFNVADCFIVVGAGLLILYFALDTVKEYKEKKKTETENAKN